MKCKYCGEDWKALMCKALLVYMGCKVHPDPTWCPDSPDHKHHFEEEEEEKAVE